MIPNAIPRRVLDLPPAYEREPHIVHIGWTGSVFTHPHDLQVVGTGLRTALDRSPLASRFSILGQARGAQERLGLAHPPAEIEWLGSVDHYLQEIGHQFDIGIAPLRNDRFNRAKSWLKPLEFASRGVYVVRSVIDEYESLGIGMRAKSPKDWAKWIDKGVRDPDYRRTVAASMREQVRNSFTTDHTAERWVSAWRQALDNRAKARR
jgi:glycosyltransferase involved in cell wall biosynthesis